MEERKQEWAEVLAAARGQVPSPRHRFRRREPVSENDVRRFEKQLFGESRGQLDAEDLERFEAALFGEQYRRNGDGPDLEEAAGRLFL